MSYFSEASRRERDAFAARLSMPTRFVFRSLPVVAQMMAATLVVLAINDIGKTYNPTAYQTVMGAVERVGGPIGDASSWLQSRNFIAEDRFASLLSAKDLPASTEFLGGRILK